MCIWCGIDNCFNGCKCDVSEQSRLEARLRDIHEDYKIGMLTREETISKVRDIMPGEYEAKDELKLMGIIVEEWE